MKLLTYSVPGYGAIKSPSSIPSGGLDTSGQSLIKGGILIFFMAAIVLALFFIIWGGIQWTSSDGNPEKIESAKKRIIFSIIGLVLALLAFLIINFIGYFFQVKLL